MDRVFQIKIKKQFAKFEVTMLLGYIGFNDILSVDKTIEFRRGARSLSHFDNSKSISSMHPIYSEFISSCPSSNRSETKEPPELYLAIYSNGVTPMELLQSSCSMQRGVWAIGVVFVQKVHEFMTRSKLSLIHI